MDNIFFDIGSIIIIATIFAYLAKMMKQPLIPAYIITGLIIGPLFGFITNTAVIMTMSEIGIAFLLFMVGMEIDMKKLSNVGLISYLGGLTQMVATFTVAFIVSMFIGFIYREAFYIGLIIAFSSTMVVVKLLSDKRQVDTLHGRIVIGILVMQDILAIFVLSVLTSLDNLSFLILIFSLLKGILLFITAYVCAKHIFPKILKFAAKSQELLFLVALTICFLFAFIFNKIGYIAIFIWRGSSLYLSPAIYNMLEPGFSIAIGAFVAGVTLANSPYTIEIIGRIKSLRDFFATIFFVSLGLELTIGSMGAILKPLIILTLVVVIFKPFILMFICSFLGYKKRTSFLSSMSLAQVSEFSLIIVAQGLILGHIGQDIFTLTILMAIITITLTSYFIKYEDRAFQKTKKYIEVFDRFTRSSSELEYMPKKKKHEVILCGYNRIGYSVVKTIRRLKKHLLVVDFNPEVIRKLMKEKVACMYGDIGDTEVLERLNLKDAKMVVSTIPTKRDNLMLIRKAKEENKEVIIFVAANQVEEALSFYDAGADYVILPHFLGGDHLSVLIEDFSGDVNKIIQKKLGHIKELHERRELGHEHPKHH